MFWLLILTVIIPLPKTQLTLASIPAPAITSITPNQGYTDQETTIAINGSNFAADTTVALGTTSLPNTTLLNAATLTATVPAALPTGSYTLTVTNSDGQHTSLPNAFTVLHRGNGSLSPWQYTSSMVVPRISHAVVKANGFLYALGGDNTNGFLKSVERSAITGGNTLGSWQIDSEMTITRSSLAAVVIGPYIYALGGLTKATGGIGLSSVERALIKPDGSLDTWEVVSSMPSSRWGLEAVVAGNYLYALGGFYGTALATVERALISPDGSLGTWETLPPMTTPREKPAAVVIGDAIYVIGGLSSYSGYQSSIERARINPDGSLGAWQIVSSMITPRFRLMQAWVDGYLYAIGGANASGDLNTVERTTISSDGTFGPWQTLPSLNNKRFALAGITIGSTIFAAGGSHLASVERATLNPSTLFNITPRVIPADQPTVITIDGTNFLPTPVLRLGESISVTTSFVSSSMLTATVPAGLSSGWYTATITNPNGFTATLPNALLVDGSKPEATSLSINGGALSTPVISVTLAVSVTDATDNSGQIWMSFANDGTAWSTWQLFKPSLTWLLNSGDGDKHVYARFRDTAGNLSAIISSTIRLDTSIQPEYGISINRGAMFTNRKAVTLTLSARPGTAQMQISNDGGFNGAGWEPYDSSKAWQISEIGNSFIPRIVYVRYKDLNGNVSPTYQDDIILDVTPPEGHIEIRWETKADAPTPQASANVTVTLSATDDVSGVASMRLGNDPAFTGAEWEPYATSKVWNLGSSMTVYVQFQDYAGNISQTYSASPVDLQWHIYVPIVTLSMPGGW